MVFYIGLIANLIYVNGSDRNCSSKEEVVGSEVLNVQGRHSSGATNPCSPLAPYATACAHSDAEALPTGNGGVPGFTTMSFQTNSASLKSSLVSGRSFWQLLGRSPKKKAHHSTLSCKHKVTRREKEGFQSSVLICLLFKGKADKVPRGCSLHFSQVTRVTVQQEEGTAIKKINSLACMEKSMMPK